MLLTSLLSTSLNGSSNFKDLTRDMLNFLADKCKSSAMAYVALAIICVLSIALVICFLIALINPRKRKLKKLQRILKRQKEYDLTRQRLFKTKEEIGTINLEKRIIKKQFDDDVFNLNELERCAYQQDMLYIENVKQQMDDIAEKYALLSEVLQKHKKGLLKTIKKDKIESTQLLMYEFASQHRQLNNEIYLKTINVEKRKAQLQLDINNLDSTLKAKLKELKTRLNTLESQQSHLESKLAKMNKQGRHKLTLTDARAMIDEFARRKKIEDKIKEDKALALLKKAKEEYELAYKQRVLAEKKKNLAVENVKSAQKELLKSKLNKSTNYRRLSEASAVIASDKPDDVNIIIADINGTDVFAPLDTDEKLLQEIAPVYEEPKVEVVDMSDIPEEDVVFIEAFLDYQELEEEENILMEVAASQDDSSQNNKQEANQTEDSTLLEEISK